MLHGSSEGNDEIDDEVNIAAKISDYSTRETGRIRPPARQPEVTARCACQRRERGKDKENGVLVWKLQEEDEKAKTGVDNQATTTDTISESTIIFIIEVDTRRGM